MKFYINEQDGYTYEFDGAIKLNLPKGFRIRTDSFVEFSEWTVEPIIEADVVSNMKLLGFQEIDLSDMNINMKDYE